MFNSNNLSSYGRHIYILRRIRTIGIVFVSILVVVFSVFAVSKIKNGAKNERKELSRIWNDGDYEKAYTISKAALQEKPVDYFLLTINGFSAYQMGIAQINSQNTLAYINECIFSLRKALLHKEAAKDGRFFMFWEKPTVTRGANMPTSP